MAATFYQVGGSVRDELLGLPSKDIDYAVEASSFEDMHQSILDRGGEVFLSKPEFLTIRAKVPNLGACDFVLCRKEGAYSDGRHPDTVEPGTIYDDLARRDFTINAIAKTEEKKLIDPYNGQKDLLTGIIRCVGATEDRFTEDGLRMLRALRFAITKDFFLDSQIHICLSAPFFFRPRLRGVSLERVREELFKCFEHDSVRTMFLLVEYGAFTEYLFGSNNTTKLWLKPTLQERGKT